MKAIALPTFSHPDLFPKVFLSLRNAIGSEQWVTMTCPDTRPPRGCRFNTHLACSIAIFAGAEWVLYIEDDILVSKDALLLCDAFIESKKDGILCLRRWHTTENENEPAIVRHADHGLLGDGFLFPKKLWPFLKEWWFRDEPQMAGKMWDWSVSWALETCHIPQWRPMIPRSQNIGACAGALHNPNPNDMNHHGPLYEGEPITQFYFVP